MIYLKMFFKMLYGIIKRLKHAVMRSYSVLAINDTEFNDTECGMSILLQESSNVILDNKAL